MIPFTNQAALSYNGITKNSNIVSGNIVETLSATKTAVNPSYAAGDTITYAVNIVNTGAVPYTGLTITDNLGQTAFGEENIYPLDYVAGTVKYFSNGALQAAPTVAAEKPLTITGITVPAGGNVTILYDAKTNGFAPLNTESSIVNTATITGGGIAAPIEATETVNVATGLNLSIVKSVSPTEVSENGQLTYTFLIENYGNVDATAADAVTVTDIFNPILKSITVTYNGTAWTAGTNYTYDETTGTFTTLAGQITVPKATFTQNAQTGAWSTTPGISTLIVTGTV